MIGLEERVGTHLETPLALIELYACDAALPTYLVHVDEHLD
jgi:hypothetical protein